MSQMQSTRKKPAKHYKVRQLRVDTPNPVRIFCIVIESRPGAAIVQDICDDMGKQGMIRVTVNGELQVAEKYILYGDVTISKKNHGEEIKLVALSAFKITSLDINLFKEVQSLGKRIKPPLNG